MGNYSKAEMCVSLRVMGRSLSVEEIERLLGVSHTTFCKKGEKLSEHSGPGAPEDVWVHDFGYVSLEEEEPDFKAVKQFLADGAAALRLLNQPAGRDVRVWISCITDRAQGGIDLDAKFLHLLDQAGVGLTVSFLSGGEV